MADENPVAQKRCSGCGTTYPATAEYYHRDKQRPDGFYPRCKVCESARRSNYLKSLQHPDNAEKLRQHKLMQREADLRRHAAHGDKRRALCRQYHAANAEKVRERHRNYIASHPEIRYHIKYPERALDSSRRFRANNPEKRRLWKLLRRAAGTVTAKDLKLLWGQQNGCCAYCGNVLQKGKMMHVDHIRPVSQGGKSDIENLCLACPRCNLEKSDRTPQEWTKRWYE